jgi:regulator of sigma E protease
MGTLAMVGQFILALSLLVALHEFGHFITAKMFKIRVERFYVFFDFLFPLPNVLNFALIKFRKGETEYGLGWFPLGGYVKIAGMVDESMDKDQMALPPKPDEFRSKPAWQRLIVMIGGVVVNVITGITVFVCMIWLYGESYMPAAKVDGIIASPVAQEIGLRTGDRIVKVNGKTFERFSDVRSPDILLGSGASYTVLRNGQEVEIKIPNDLISKLQDKKEFIDPFLHFSVGKVKSGFPAEKAGLQPGDRILKINEKNIGYYHELQAALRDNKNKAITLQISRKNQTQDLKATVTPDGLIGFQPQFDDEQHESVPFGQALVKGTQMAFTVIFTQIQGFGKMFRGEISVTKSLSGPIEIAELFGTVWNWQNFWYLVGLLSMVLAFMNLLPIPALDGGHVVFLLYEIITGKAPSDKFLEGAQRVGMAFLLCLTFFVLSKGIFNKIF